MQPLPRAILFASAATLAYAGRASLGGSLFPAVISLAALDGATGFRTDGTAQNDTCGAGVASADVNADGIPDLIIGAPGGAPGGVSSAGSVFVVFGKDTGGPGGPFPASLSLTTLNGANGFRLNGVLQSDVTGASVANAGDVNADGVDDIIIGAPFADPNGSFLAGSAFVFFGRNTAVSGPFPATIALSSLNGTDGFRLDSAAIVETCGRSVASAGDINHDGVGDVIIGAESSSPGGAPGGRAFVVFGKNTALAGPFPPVLALSTLNGVNGFILQSGASTEQCGRSVACAGDVNDDGVSDIIIGAPGADPGLIGNAGTAYVVFGKDTVMSGAFPALFNLGGLTGSNGFRVNGAADLEAVGFSCAGIGDLNADGVDDIALGAPSASPGNVTTSGTAYVIFGKNTAMNGAFPSVMSVASLDGANGFRLNGVLQFDQAGSAVAGAGDVNHDGVADLLIGAVGNSSLPGRAFVFFGHNTRGGPFPAAMSLGALDGANGFRLDGAGGNDQTGFAVGRGGDLNDDGLDDAVIGAQHAGFGGRAYVVYGRGAAPCPGDTNGDRAVDFFDLNNVLTDYNQSGAALTGDVDHDGDCDFFDLNILLTNFGTAC